MSKRKHAVSSGASGSESVRFFGGPAPTMKGSEIQLTKTIADHVRKITFYSRDIGPVLRALDERRQLFITAAQAHDHDNRGASSEAISKSIAPYYEKAIRACEAEIQNINNAIRYTGMLMGSKKRRSEDMECRDTSNDGDYRQRKQRRALILKILSEGNLPVWTAGNPPPLCGRIMPPTDYIVPKLDWVAAKTSKSKDDDSVWILAVVTKFNHENHRYEVEDIMEEDITEANPGGGSGGGTGELKTYTLTPRMLIPLPKWSASPDCQEALFPKSSSVLALYPQTTCFYPASVSETPSRKSPDYYVYFNDDEDVDGDIPARRVPQRFVLNSTPRRVGKHKNQQ